MPLATVPPRSADRQLAGQLGGGEQALRRAGTYDRDIASVRRCRGTGRSPQHDAPTTRIGTPVPRAGRKNAIRRAARRKDQTPPRRRRRRPRAPAQAHLADEEAVQLHAVTAGSTTL